MRIIEKKQDLKSLIEKEKYNDKTIGFVPTMGALHLGHLSLVKTSCEKNDITVVSIFINPVQFNRKEDLRKYPRDIPEDLKKLENYKVDYVFIPSETEMYPQPDTTKYDFGKLDKVMEGKYREGHFNGVAIVVRKLFDIVQPDIAYFGQKDFQQVVIIKDLIRQLQLKVEIVTCPIIREEDGLALSSRNLLLTPEERENASLISKTLFEAQSKCKQMQLEELRNWVINTINGNPFLLTEYFEIVDEDSLQPVHDWTTDKQLYGCVAVNVGNVRLIDNVKFNL